MNFTLRFTASFAVKKMQKPQSSRRVLRDNRFEMQWISLCVSRRPLRLKKCRNRRARGGHWGNNRFEMRWISLCRFAASFAVKKTQKPRRSRRTPRIIDLRSSEFHSAFLRVLSGYKKQKPNMYTGPWRKTWSNTFLSWVRLFFFWSLVSVVGFKIPDHHAREWDFGKNHRLFNSGP